MNKLISRNPVQRFKEGGYKARHKEEKGQARFNAKFRKTGEYPGKFLNDMLQGRGNSPKGIPYKDKSEIYVGPYEGSWLTYSSLIGDHNNQNKEIYDRGVAQVQQMKKSNPQETVPLDNQNSYAAQNKRYILQQPVTSTTQTNITSTPVNNITSTNTNNTTTFTSTKSTNTKSNKASTKYAINTKSAKESSFAKAFKEARAKGLKEFVWNGQKKNTMKAGETKEQWLKNLGTKKTSQQKEVVASNQPVMEKVKTQTVVPSSQEIGNWTQALIEAQQPQQTVSSNYIPTSEDVMNWMQSFKYKQGGILPSRNPVKRFKNRNFI